MTEIEHARDVVDEYMDLCDEEKSLQEQIEKLQKTLKNVQERKRNHAATLERAIPSGVRPGHEKSLLVFRTRRPYTSVVVCRHYDRSEVSTTTISITETVAAREHP